MFIKFIVVVFSFFTFCFADMDVKMPANITSIKVANNSILVGLDNGELVRYKNKQITKEAQLPKISNYFNQNINSRIYQIDYLSDNFIVALAEGDNLEKIILVIKNGKSQIIQSPISYLKQVLILNENTLILMGPNCEVNYFDLLNNKITYTDKWTISGFEKAVLDVKNHLLLITCEGGIVFYYDTNKKKLIKQEALHKDRIYDIAKFDNRIFTGTPERKARYFDGNNEHWFSLRFPVYKVALNKNFGAYTSENSIIIIDKNANKIKEIPYNGTLLTDLEFYQNNELVGAGYDNKLHFWSIK